MAQKSLNYVNVKENSHDFHFFLFLKFIKAVFLSLQLPLDPESAISFCKRHLFPFL